MRALSGIDSTTPPAAGLTVRELAPGYPVGFRNLVAEDREFVISSWLRSHQRDGDWLRRLESRGRYFDRHGPVVERLLAHAKTLVACNPLEPSRVLGYVCHEPGVLHYLLVKAPFRWDGTSPEHPRIGSALLAEAFGNEKPIDCSHWTRDASERARRWFLRYDPFLLAVSR